jgi:SagB-type dehydrogenase family enzyme
MIVVAFFWRRAGEVDQTFPPSLGSVSLPVPVMIGEFSVEEALANRRSVREYSDQPLTLSEIGQLLWAAQGITEPGTGKRTAPSAGALYPLELYVATGNVEGLPPGVYKYNPYEHRLLLIKRDDVRTTLRQAAIDQSAVEEGSAILVFASVHERTTQKYGERGIRYVHMEVGSAIQNVYLQAESLGLSTVIIGAFTDSAVQSVMGMDEMERPLGIMPVGRK